MTHDSQGHARTKLPANVSTAHPACAGRRERRADAADGAARRPSARASAAARAQKTWRAGVVARFVKGFFKRDSRQLGC